MLGELIPGLLKRLQIRALTTLRRTEHSTRTYKELENFVSDRISEKTCGGERLENFKCHFDQERLGNFKCHFYQTSNIKRTETLDRSANPGSTFSMQRKYGYFSLVFLSCSIQSELSGLFLRHTFHPKL